MTLTPRLLGRTQRPVSPLLWRLGDAPIEVDILTRAARAGANWLYLSHDAPEETVGAIRESLARVNVAFSFVIGIAVDALQSRAATPLQQRLAALGVKNCAAVMLQNVVAADVKSGRPFHRLMQLRDRGLVQTFWIESQTCADAEWMIENTPAHALSLPFGVLDQTARYRVAAASIELGTAIVAAPVASPVWQPPKSVGPAADIAYSSGESAIASILRPFPATHGDLEAMLSAAAHPMPEADREDWWKLFQQVVPSTPKPPHGHGPEFGA